MVIVFIVTCIVDYLYIYTLFYVTVMMCKSHTGPVFHSYKLVGLAMSDQFDLLFEHLENYLKAGQLGESQVFHKEVVSKCEL